MRCDLKIGFAGLCGTRIGKQKKQKKNEPGSNLRRGRNIFELDFIRKCISQLSSQSVDDSVRLQFLLLFFSSLSSVV